MKKDAINRKIPFTTAKGNSGGLNRRSMSNRQDTYESLNNNPQNATNGEVQFWKTKDNTVKMSNICVKLIPLSFHTWNLKYGSTTQTNKL